MTDSRIRSGDSLSEGLAEGLLAVLKDDQSLRVRVAVLQLADQLTGLTGWTNFGGGGLQDSREGGGQRAPADAGPAPLPTKRPARLPVPHTTLQRDFMNSPDVNNPLVGNTCSGTM